MIRKSLLLAAVVLFAMPAFAQLNRGEISVSYGASPVTNWIDTYSGILSDVFVGSETELDGWGAVTVGYNFRLIGGFSVGATVGYTSNQQRIKNTSDRIDNRYWSVMPNVKWNWLGLKIVSFYSRLGAGVTFSKSESGSQAESSRQFAFQVSPIGVEVGGSLAAYAEVGIGTSGCLIVGARYRF